MREGIGQPVQHWLHIKHNMGRYRSSGSTLITHKTQYRNEGRDRSTGSTTFSRTYKAWRVGYGRWIWSFVATTRFRNLQKSSLSCRERVTPQLFIWFHWLEVIDSVDPPLPHFYIVLI
jgi:hypothetical protein